MSRTSEISGVCSWCRTNSNKVRLSVLASIYHVWWFNVTVSQTYNGALRNILQWLQFHVSFTQTVSMRLWAEMFDFQMNIILPLHCAEAAYHVKLIWNYEWWVKLWLIGLVIPVYTLFIPPQLMHGVSLNPLLCPKSQPAPNLPIRSPLQRVQIPSGSQNLLPFDYFITVVFHKLLCLLWVTHMLKMQNSWSYSFQMFVSVLNETKISDILSHCKHSSSVYMYTTESSLVKHSVGPIWICC